MIWLLLTICISLTLFFFENVITMLGNYISAVYADVHNIDASELKVTIKRQMIISTTLIIICGVLWSMFFFYWN